MTFKFTDYSFIYEKRRFTDKEISGELTSRDVISECRFSEEGRILFIKAIKAAAQSSIDLAGKGKILPLQGVIDLATGQISIGALTPRDSQAIIFNKQPLFEHRQPGLFETGQYSPRLRSYQTRYSVGPSAHQQLLHHLAVTKGKKDQVSAEDAKDKRGFAINIIVSDDNIKVIVDGNSLSINETAQYLRNKHAPGHELTESEARNEVLKAEGTYSQYCESWVLDRIEQACQHIVADRLKIETSFSSLNQRVTFFAESGEDTFDRQMEEFNQLPDHAAELPPIVVNDSDDAINNEMTIISNPINT